MAGHCSGCGVYHEEDDGRQCWRCVEAKVNAERVYVEIAQYQDRCGILRMEPDPEKIVAIIAKEIRATKGDL